MSSLYDTVAYTWATKQADALRRRSANEIDWENVAEKIESVGKSEARELESRYSVLLAHLLKWAAQPENSNASSEMTIKLQRREIARHLDRNPGLKVRRDDLFGGAYFAGQASAAIETNLALDGFPKTNPFTFDQTMDPSFWPEG